MNQPAELISSINNLKNIFESVSSGKADEVANMLIKYWIDRRG